MYAHDAPDHGFDTNAIPPPEARTWAMLAHVAGLAGFVIPIVGSIFGPLLVWLLKRETHPYIDEQGR